MTFSRVILLAHAERVTEALRGYCRRLEVTGALRREEPNGSSIDFVCLTDQPEGVAERCLRHTFRVKLDAYRFSATMQNGLALNIWFARPPVEDIFEPRPSNFEVMQVIHTPTRLYLRDFVRYIHTTGYFLNRDLGLVTPDNRQVAHTEAGIYDALDLEMPHPTRQLEFRPRFVRNTVEF